MIETDISRFSQLGKTYVSGDFNARTGNSDDNLVFAKYLQEDNNDQGHFTKRINKDHVLDVYGRRLFDLCKATGLLIANGRIGQDKDKGDFTFCSKRGQRVIDYLLIPPNDRRDINNFAILPFEEHSDQAGLGYIQTGCANVKTTASLLYKNSNATRRVRCECSK